MPLNFTLAYNDGTNDVDDVTGDVARVGTWGSMWFEPVFKSAGARLVSSDGATCPRLFSGVIENGVLKAGAGGATNVRLWANDPSWSLTRFQYRVRADLTDALGLPIPWEPFYFDAPDADVSVDLKDYIPRPGQPFGRGPGAFRLSGGSFDGSDRLVLENADGSTLSPIDIPSGVLVFIDNGDGTLTVGP